MADYQQEKKVAIHLEHHLDSKQDRTKEETTKVMNTTNLRRSIDQPIYTAAVQKVLNHNFNHAERTAPPVALTSVCKLTDQYNSDAPFTILQRPVNFNVEWENRSLFKTSTSKAFTICPTVILPLPEMTAGAPTLAYWRFGYTVNGEAALARLVTPGVTEPLEKSLGIRDVATFTYADLEKTNGGPTIMFKPHEHDFAAQGPVKATTRDMILSKDMFGGTKYSVNLPDNLGGEQVMWTLTHVKGYADGRLLGSRSKEVEVAQAETLKEEENKYAGQCEASKTSWSIYPQQQLIYSNTGRIVATYTRNAPGSRMAGTLTIFPKLLSTQPEQYENLTSALIEGVVIVTAAMVDVQRRSGLLSGLLEAGKEVTRWLEEAPHPLHSDP